MSVNREDIELKKLEELREIKRELQNIRVILQSQFIKDYEVIKTKDENGKTIRTRRTLVAPLEQLRKRYNMFP